MPKSKNPGKWIARQLSRSLTSPVEQAGNELIERLLTTALEGKEKKTPKRKAGKVSGGHSLIAPTSAPAAQAGQSSVMPITSSSKGDVTVMKGKVLIGTLEIPAGDFESTFIRINPSNMQMFPQLGVAAKLFTKYRFKKLSFIFVNPGQPTTAQGQIVAGISYDPSPMGPFTKEEIVNRSESVKMPVWEPEMILEARNLPKGWSILQESFASGTRAGVDVGYLVMGTENLGSGTAITDACEVYVSYEVELKDRRPDMDSAYTTTTNSILLYSTIDGTYTSGAVVYPSWHSPFNSPVSYIAGTFAGVANAGFYLPKGVYRVQAVLPFYAGTIAATNFTVQVILKVNPTTPVTLDMLTQAFPAGHVTTNPGTRGVMLAEFYFESPGHAYPPTAADDDACFGLTFSQNSGNTVTMYGVSSTNRRSLIIQPI